MPSWRVLLFSLLASTTCVSAAPLQADVQDVAVKVKAAVSARSNGLALAVPRCNCDADSTKTTVTISSGSESDSDDSGSSGDDSESDSSSDSSSPDSPSDASDSDSSSNDSNSDSSTPDNSNSGSSTQENSDSSSIDLSVVLSLPDIVNGCTDKVSPLVDQLKSLPASDCTSANIQPIALEIKGALSAAIDQINVLAKANLGVDAILTTSGSALSIQACAQLIANLSIMIFACISVVLKLVVSAELTAVIAIFADLCITLGSFIQISCGLVAVEGGLLAVVTPLIKTSLGVCITLGITSAFEFCGIDFVQLGLDLGISAGATLAVGASVSIVTIINECTAKVGPLLDQLKGLGADDCTSDNIGAIVVQIKDILVSATVQVKGLIGATVDVALASDAGVSISVSDCAKLVGDFSISLFVCIDAVLKVVVSAEIDAVISVFAELGVCIGDLLNACCSVVTFDGTLVAVLVPIIKASLGVCITLGCTDAFGFLGIDFNALATELGIAVGTTVVVSLPSIIADVTAQITPLIAQLKGLGADECTGDKVGAIVAQIKVILVAATAQVNLLVNVGADVALKTTAGAVLSVDACAKVCADLCTLIFGCLDIVIGLVLSVNAQAVIIICADLGVCVGAFIQACCSVIVGLQASLVGLISVSLGVCIKLAITDAFAFLGVNFKDLAASLGLNFGGLLHQILGFVPF
ncbi:hypothetical protein V5O48_005704 [Marasmius crinis-equi]|uniref:Uncharacterized protein n=1 Tax=Marasmius crinis-equi TaxID=585013 RepID=A0ABR3FLI7_9AGAR